MFLIESAKLSGLHGNMGYMGACIVWVHGFCGSNYYMGCVGYMGQNIFLHGSTFYVGCVGQKFLRGSLCGSKFFACVNFWGVVLKKSQLALSQ